MNSRRASIATCTLLALATLVRADETTFCNAYITTLPYTIATQGHYCFDRNLSTAIATGNAVTINADFVVLDLNNFKLGGGGAGLATFAYGIYANNRRNITIRNGNIRGFHHGIRLDGTPSTSGNHVIENNVLDGNTYVAARAQGDVVVMRNNVVSNTGGSTAGIPSTVALWSAYDVFMHTRDNVITNTFAQAGGYHTSICCGAGQHDHNLIKGGAGAGLGDDAGIVGSHLGGTVCRDNTVFNLPAGQAIMSCDLAGHNFSSP